MNNVPFKSGNHFIDGLFDLCVRVLIWIADLFGVSYNTINIWIFCVIWPILTVILIAIVVRQRIELRYMKKNKNLRGGGTI